ncbi:hypothetical protein [Pseudomonas putida]
MGNTINKINTDGVHQRLLAVPLECFFAFVAVSTLALTVALNFNWRFDLVARAIITGAVIIVIWSFARLFKLYSSIRLIQSVRGFLLVALGGALLSGLLAASINRPDIDDSIYGAKAVYYLDHPMAPIDRSVTWLAGLPHGSDSIVFQYYETAQAALAWGIGAEFLTVYHVVFPFLVGCLFFLSALLLISVFEQSKFAGLWGAAMLVVISVMLGETHRSFGNISIARDFQGKFVFVCVGAFSLVYYALRYLVWGRLSQLLALTVGSVAMVGLTTTSFVFVPLLAGVIWVSFQVSEFEGWQRLSVRRSALYFFSLLPLFMYAFFFSVQARQYISAGSQVNSGFSSDFWGQLNYVVNPSLPVSMVLLVVTSAVLVWKSSCRRFFLTWLLLPLLLLNPAVSGYVIKYVTTENIYWRLFYLLPFPLVVPLAALCFYKETTLFKTGYAAGLVVAIVVAVYGPTSVLRSSNSAQFDPFSYKMMPLVKTSVEAMRDQLPTGSMLAPIDIASNVVLVTSKFSLVYFRDDYLGFVLNKEHLAGELEVRQQAVRFLYAGDISPHAKKAAQELLMRRDRPSYIVLPVPFVNEGGADFLKQYGYYAGGLDVASYQVFVSGVR